MMLLIRQKAMKREETGKQAMKIFVLPAFGRRSCATKELQVLITDVHG
ncbi:MAG: hypothetical protein K9K75_06055 [Deltaproteobacteria bacterium]|nr:hypothetical protein [Deltaproteobacteria bacterium]